MSLIRWGPGLGLAAGAYSVLSKFCKKEYTFIFDVNVDFSPFDRKCHGYFTRKWKEGHLSGFSRSSSFLKWQYIFFLSFFFLVFFYFRATPTVYGSSEARGQIGAQPQQCQIQAVSVTYTTAHSMAESSTSWVRPGIKPTSSWMLVRFISAEPWWELLYFHLNFLIYCFYQRILSVLSLAPP